MKTDQPPLTAILIGAGIRGQEVYANWALKHARDIRFIGVAEPQPDRLQRFIKDHTVKPGYFFKSWEELLALGKIADLCFICTQDNFHYYPAKKALEIGYNVVLEKPMAVTLSDCKDLVQLSERKGLDLRICHVARYTQFFSRLKETIHEGRIGGIININHAENVAYWHFVHGYVRGNWGNERKSSPVILAKTCHDLDLLYYLTESSVKSIQSFGQLTHYRRNQAPEGATQRCTDGCPHEGTCLYSAPALYLRNEPILQVTQLSDRKLVRVMGKIFLNHPKLIKFLSILIPPIKRIVNWRGWPVSVITEDYTYEGKLDALKTGDYGRCVYYCDNDVPDHQTVNIQFESGVTATMTMHGHSFLDGRFIRVDGTKGTIIGKFTYAGEELRLYEHGKGKSSLIWKAGINFSGHGGGDEGLMESLVKTFHKNPENLTPQLTSAKESLESHLMAFAAEISRKENRVVELKEIR